jgi:hypothetical protein
MEADPVTLADALLEYLDEDGLHALLKVLTSPRS